MITKSQAVSNFLKAFAKPDLAQRYSTDMECQVNVAKDNGEPIQEEYNGVKWKSWTDGIQTWKPFRIPRNAATKPVYEDKEMNFDLSAHVDAIGMTGWNWRHLQSQWVAFDFDSITGHEKGLTDEELAEIIQKVENIPWIQVRKSSSGKGYHLYVYLNPYIATSNHNEHAALARAILSKISAICCFDFRAKVDTCGGNIWVWHRKMKGTDGFSIIKEYTEELAEVPPNWKDHVKVVVGTKKRVVPDFIANPKEGNPVEDDIFEQLCGQYNKIELDEKHIELINYLKDKGDTVWWWDSDRHMLVTHTIYLKEAQTSLNLKGIFDTKAQGKERGSDHNCFCYPMRKGAWVVRRFSPGCQETATWDQDKQGWTRCFYNKEPDLATASRYKGGVELGDNKGYQFREAEMAVTAAKHIGVDITVPIQVASRETILKEQKDGKLIVEIQKTDHDNPEKMEGWANAKTKWRKVYNTPGVVTSEVDAPVCDDILRHVVTEMERSNAGWYILSNGHWQREPIEHVRPFLKSHGHVQGMIDPILGLCLQRPWREVNRPFDNEYVGDRDWNRRGAKLRYSYNPDTENLQYGSWLKILNHIGASLTPALKNNEWATRNAILTGADYLKCWVASLFQKPYEPLPYLFLYGPQDCGKSIFYEALQLLFDRGHVQANHALLSQTGFNGELANAVLCYIEEIDLSKAKYAYNKVKDWVTSKYITIREMNKNAYQLPNSTHWVQCANDHNFCPHFSGDTRITVIEVESLDVTEVIPKHKFLKMLEKEAPDFLAAVLKLELPEPISRLSVPVITTVQKISLENLNRPAIGQFIEEKCFEAPGHMTKLSEVFDAFTNWLPPELQSEWNKIRFVREFPTKYPKGVYTNNISQIGNLSLVQIPKDKFETPWTISEKGRLERVR